MKKINKYGAGLVLLLASTSLMTGCIDETFPTSGVTQKQIKNSTTASENLVVALPAYLNKKYFSTRYDFDYGYGSLMHIRDIQTADFLRQYSNYDQYWTWAENLGMGKQYTYAAFQWGWQTKMVNQANNLLAAVDSVGATDEEKAYRGVAYAFRALMYLDMAREYEFLPNDETKAQSPDGNDITNLTVPITTESTTEDQAQNNPRATREQMAKFILSDLQQAEKLIPNLSGTAFNSEKVLPHLDAVYGLYARYYMWLENYPMAEKYAAMAIKASSVGPMSESDALNVTSGFNDPSKWMWASTVSKEAIESNLANWVSFASNETSFGYAGGGGCYTEIDAAMYNRISDTDWRKLEWKAPDGSALSGKNSYIDANMGSQLPAYASLKFRPGGGNTTTYSVAAVTSYPLMRVEEMYFIEAEAAAHQDAARGKQLLEEFMKTYRDPQYTTDATSTEDVVEEIVFQKRVELWGEGQSFFDIKRLNIPIKRNYDRTNHDQTEAFNTTTRPAWMNWVFPMNTEEEVNAGLKGYNNPDPSYK